MKLVGFLTWEILWLIRSVFRAEKRLFFGSKGVLKGLLAGFELNLVLNGFYLVLLIFFKILILKIINQCFFILK